MRELWTADRVTFEGEYYRTLDAAIYDRPPTRCPCTWRPADLVARYAGRVADGFICTSGKGPRAVCRPAGPGRRRGSGPGRSGARVDRPDDRGQGVVGPRTPSWRWRTPGSGRPCRCRPSRSTRSTARRRWRRRGRRAADRAGGPALGRGLPSLGRRRGAADVHRPRFPTTSSCMGRGTTRSVSCRPSPSRCCRGCASLYRRGVDGDGRRHLA